LATILVVDDEPSVLLVTTTILNRSGYRVLTAADGNHALSAFENADDTIHLVLSDIAMPGMTGHQLARVIRDLSPSTAVLLMSAAWRFPHNSGVPGIAKPFSRERLMAKVRNLLRTCDFAQIEREQSHARSRLRGGNPGNRQQTGRRSRSSPPDAPCARYSRIVSGRPLGL
jgi:DNA-binding response OmpR family regulator